jgi:hypothetical protein
MYKSLLHEYDYKVKEAWVRSSWQQLCSTAADTCMCGQLQQGVYTNGVDAGAVCRQVSVHSSAQLLLAIAC